MRPMLAGVRRLNAGGAGLPVEETAASLAVLAKQQGLRGIGYVELGAAMADGRQNVFIGEGNPGDPAGRRAFMARDGSAALRRSACRTACRNSRPRARTSRWTFGNACEAC